MVAVKIENCHQDLCQHQQCDLGKYSTSLPRIQQDSGRILSVKKFSHNCKYCEFSADRNTLVKIHEKIKHTDIGETASTVDINDISVSNGSDYDFHIEALFNSKKSTFKSWNENEIKRKNNDSSSRVKTISTSKTAGNNPSRTYDNEISKSQRRVPQTIKENYKEPIITNYWLQSESIEYDKLLKQNGKSAILFVCELCAFECESTTECFSHAKGHHQSQILNSSVN